MGVKNRLKWLFHVLMLQWSRFWFALISRLRYVHTLPNLPYMSSYPFEMIG